MKKQIYIFLILAVFVQKSDVFSQFHSEYFNSSIEKPEYKGKLILNLNASGFFHNNEFFGTDVEGYTLTGNYIQPSICYLITDNLRIGAGIHLLKYNGQEGFNQQIPLLNISYGPIDNLEILLGSFNGGDNFLLPEALYARELNFTNLVNNGARIKYKSERISVQTWLDWEKFIEWGDPFREELSFGTHLEYSVIKKEKYQIRIPVYLLANHKGGQINNNNQAVETIADLSTGLKYSLKPEWKALDSLSFEALVFFESDIESEQSGTAFYVGTEARKSIISASAGYFHANNWESIHGNPLLFAGDFNTESSKDMVLLKAGIGKSIGNKSSFSLRFEGYYDLGINKFQYIYGFYLTVNEALQLIK